MLTQEQISIGRTVEARQAQIDGAQAWELLRGAQEIVVGQGKKIVVLRPLAATREEILAHCLGRSGTLRAPALQIGGRFVIGFNEEMYRTYLR